LRRRSLAGTRVDHAQGPELAKQVRHPAHLSLDFPQTIARSFLMYPKNRRVFMLQVFAGASALAVSQPGMAEEEKVTEADPYAKSMGFRLDTTKVDQARYPRHDAATQQCAKCQLYSGKPGDQVGPCSFFGGRLVSPNGWCKNFKALKA
jgi:hypothetical protein